VGDLIKASSPELLKKATVKERDRLFRTPAVPLLRAAHLSITTESSFSGPIPPPDLLAEYERILPSSASRIFEMAERQSAHRQQLENNAISHQLKQSGRGQLFGFILGIIGVIGATVVGIFGHWGVGVAVAAGTLGTLTASFVIGQSNQKNDLKKKAG
jgi:uncharacterized membrane protein